MRKNTDAGRYVQLTEAGLKRLQTARRRYKVTFEDISSDRSAPSINTVKRVFKQGAVFVSTLERIWDFFQRSAEETGERLAYLIEGDDYIPVDQAEGSAAVPQPVPEQEGRSVEKESRPGWMSRHVPRPNRLFTGREGVLQHLQTALQAGPAALTTDPLALTGLGGIGKTQTALAYIYRHWRDYSRVFWVNAESVETLNDGLVGLAEELKLLDAAPARKNQALAMMHDWFRNESRWLLVLDNADDLESLAPHFPRHHAGHLILTTRNRNTVKWAAPVPLHKLGPEEGALLLLRRAGVLDMHQSLEDAPADVSKAARELCAELDGLPLALNQAGAYLAETTGAVSEYHARYRDAGLRLLDSVTDAEHAAVTITFTLALEQMAQRSLYGKEAVEMVTLCALLAPDAIPEAIFVAYGFDRSRSATPSNGAADYDAICAAVCNYSMVSRNPQSKTLTVHRLVQKVIRDTMPAEELRFWTERTVQAVANATPDFEFEDWSLCDLLLPQWRLCTGYIRDGKIESAQAAYMLYQSGRYLRARALYEEAEAQLRLALAIAEKVYDANTHIIADYLDELACLYRVLDRREEAEPLHQRAVETLEKVEGPEHILLTSKLHNMALLYLQYEEYGRAEALFLRALAIHEKQPDPDYPVVAATLTQLAGVYRMLKRFEEAERYCLRALEIEENLHPSEHVNIAAASNNLGLLYLTMGRYEQAETLYERALKINEKLRGKEHPETGAAVWGLARLRWKQYRIEEADACFQRAIGIYTRHFGPSHALSVRITGMYAQFRQETERQPGK